MFLMDVRATLPVRSARFYVNRSDQNATDLCDPMLSDNGIGALTASFYIIFAIIVMFALLYGYAGGVVAATNDTNQVGLSKSMSYFQLKPVAAITENFL